LNNDNNDNNAKVKVTLTNSTEVMYNNMVSKFIASVSKIYDSKHYTELLIVLRTSMVSLLEIENEVADTLYDYPRVIVDGSGKDNSLREVIAGPIGTPLKQLLRERIDGLEEDEEIHVLDINTDGKGKVEYKVIKSIIMEVDAYDPDEVLTNAN
jgi:hypothetical protein